MKTIKYLIILISIGLSLGSCKKIEQLPPVPLVKFTSFTVFDTITQLGKYKAGRLEFYFEDGDGDLGSIQSGDGGVVTEKPDLYLSLFRKKGGIMVPSTDPNDSLSYRIPYMERPGVNKILKGTISVSIFYFLSPTDTIKYDFFITDRASNVSNVASTGEIVVAINKIYTK
jgi:hypothetical protein